MNYWVVSPNASNNTSEQPHWEEKTLSRGIAIMGWAEGDVKGDVFFKKVQKGDCILIAQGANWQKRLLMAGIVETDALTDSIEIGNSIRQYHYRKLGELLDKSCLQKLDLDFEAAAYGKSSQLPAIYQFYPHKNDADKIITEKLYEAFSNLKSQELMNEYTKLLNLKWQIILQGAPGTGKTYTAKDIAYQLIFNKPISTEKEKRKEHLRELSISEQFTLIQFHPAYAYEDFVRGISAKANGQGIEYKTENKILAEFAQKANQNYLDSQKEVQQLSKEKQLEINFEEFKDYIESALEQNLKFDINEVAYIYGVEDDAFRYKGDNWNNNQRMKFDDIKKLHFSNITERKLIKTLDNVSGLAKQHATYYFLMLKKFQEFIKDKKTEITNVDKIALKNYVLIIDEINRANLPAVLGELIYALEYRNEPVSSMYDLEGDRTIILPKNLYIIGTMNTADRSVGHIDYAIRRRFAFVDIAADENVITNEKAKGLFRKVKEIFEKHIAPDFELKDIELGHSYYLADDDEKLKLKLEYEIKSILREYVKDGILTGGDDIKKQINALNV
jgi:5-methylcytosine-specific restriction enzyme B